MKLMPGNKGFTLVEVMIAIVVLCVGLLGVLSLQTTSTGDNSLARTITEASTFSSEQLETLLFTRYSSATLLDTNNDGLAGLNRPFPSLPLQPGQVIPDGNYIVAPDFAGLAPDFRATSPDGNYTLCWNVAIDTPLRNVKTVRVIAISTGRGVQKVVPITFTKGR